MDKVALVRCADYRRGAVEEAVDRVFTLCGGMEQFVQPGMRVQFFLCQIQQIREFFLEK